MKTPALIALLLVTLLSISLPRSEAIIATGSIVGGTNGATCQTSAIRLHLTDTGEINDGGGFDAFYWELVDANGILLYESFRGTPIGFTHDFIFSIPFSLNAPTARPFRFRVYDLDGLGNVINIDVELIFDPLDYGITSCDDTVGAGIAPPVYVDGRLCIWDDYAIYTDSNSIDVYRIRNSGGFLVASVNQNDLDAHPGTPDTNTLISEQNHIFFYRLGNSDTYEVHVGPFTIGHSKFVRFTGLPAANVTCEVIHYN